MYCYQVYFYILFYLAFRFSVSVWRCGVRSLRPSAVGRLLVRVCRGRVCGRLSPSAVAVRTGPLSVFVSAAVATWVRSLRLCPRSVSVCPPWVAVSVLDAVSGSVCRSSVSVRSSCSAVRAYRGGGSVWSAVRPALSFCGSAVGRCGRRESSARALCSASGGARRGGWIEGRVGPAPPRFASFQLFDVNFLVVTH